MKVDKDKIKLSPGLYIFTIFTVLAVRLLGWVVFLWFTVNCLRYLGVNV